MRARSIVEGFRAKHHYTADGMRGAWLGKTGTLLIILWSSASNLQGQPIWCSDWYVGKSFFNSVKGSLLPGFDPAYLRTLKSVSVAASLKGQLYLQA